MYGLSRTLESIFAQTWHDYELIVIDGGSTDGSAELIEENAGRIAYRVSEKDRGIYHAMNKGVRRTSGEYCLFLNSGDVFHDNEVLKHLFSEMRENDCDIIVGSVQKAPGQLHRMEPRPLVFMNFWYNNPIPHQGALIKRRLFNDLEYDENLRVVSDWKFFMEAVFVKKCSYRKSDVLVADFEEGGTSSAGSLMHDEYGKVLREMLPEAVYNDFERLAQSMDYDSFFLRLRNRKYSGLIYTICVLTVRMLSAVFPTTRFARDYPLKWK